MAANTRPKMTISDRAKQFMPFSALRGLNEILATKEKIVVPKVELSEERKDELDTKFLQVHRGCILTVTHFCRGEYLRTTGMVAKISTDSRTLQVVNTIIRFDDIFDLQIDTRNE